MRLYIHFNSKKIFSLEFCLLLLAQSNQDLKYFVLRDLVLWDKKSCRYKKKHIIESTFSRFVKVWMDDTVWGGVATLIFRKESEMKYLHVSVNYTI